MSQVWPSRPSGRQASWGWIVWLLVGTYVSLWAWVPCDAGYRVMLLSERLSPSPGPPRREQGRSELWFSSKVGELAR